MSNEETATMTALLRDIREDVRALTQSVTDLIRSIDQEASDSKTRLDHTGEDFMRIVMVVMEEWSVIKAEREAEKDEPLAPKYDEKDEPK